MNNFQLKNTWNKICHHLSLASSAHKYLLIRKRYASKEQWKFEKKEIEKSSKDNWFLAKELICSHKDQLDKFINDPNISISTYEIQAYQAACQVIEKEMLHETEKLLTNE